MVENQEPIGSGKAKTEIGPEANSLVGQILSGDFALLSIQDKSKPLLTYLAKQISCDRMVSITTLQEPDPRVDAQFEGEYYQSSRLSHENIARNIAFFRLPTGQPFWVRESCYGITLVELLGSVPRIELEEEISQTLLPICSALHYAHSIGVAHGALTPKDIMLVADANGAIMVKLMNFGISALASNRDIFTSPERFLGAPPSAQADIFSFGVIAYQCISGQLPERGEQPTTLRYPPLSRLRPELRCAEVLSKIIDDAIEPEPEWRAEEICEIDTRIKEWISEVIRQRQPVESDNSLENVEVDSTARQSVKEMMKESVHNLLTMKSTQFSQEQTMMMKLTTTIAVKGPRQSPRKTLIKAMALLVWTLIFTGTCIYFGITRNEEIVDGFYSASHFLSTTLLGRSYYDDSAEQEILKTGSSTTPGAPVRSARKRPVLPAPNIMRQGDLGKTMQKRFKYEESQDFSKWLVREEYGKLRRIDATGKVKAPASGNNE